MKKIIYIVIVGATLVNVACKKERTCACKTTSTTTRTVTPRSGGSATITVTSNSNESEDSYQKIKKSEMIRLYDCNSRVETSTNTGTTIITTSSVTGSGSFTITTYKNEVADQKYDYNREYTCEIK